MALFKIEKGLASNLSKNRKTTNEGYCYFTTDDGKFYIDIATGSDLTKRICLNAYKADQWKDAITVNGLAIDGTENVTNYGICSTDAATVEKSVSCNVDAGGQPRNYVMGPGAEVTVKFTVTNTAENPKLNVNNTGAQPIYYRGAAISKGYLAADRTYTFRYNGSGYELVGDINTDTNNKVSQVQVANSVNANYHLLLASSTKISTSTAAYVKKNGSLYYNPNTQLLVSPKFSGTLSGKATSAGVAEAFATAKTITLEGDVNGTSTSTGGWTISTTLATTGVSSGSYGLSSNISPAFSSSFSIPYITVDTKGRITSATTHTVTLPKNPNSDTKVTNTVSSTATKVYITGTTTSTTATGTQVFSPAIYLNASTQTIVASKFSGTATKAETADSVNWSNVVSKPTSLKNPYALTIQGNGTTLTNGTYDGSASKTVNITPSSIGAAAASHVHDYLPLSGGTLTGNLTGKYITGTWLQTTETTNKNAVSTQVAVIDDAGWLYYRTPAQIISDAGVTATTTELNYTDGVTSNIQTQLNNKLPLSGGTITGNILFSNSSGQTGQPNLKWKTIHNSTTNKDKTPFIGYCTASTDGTFMVGSLEGTSYTTGLAIGGSSGNLLWKSKAVATEEYVRNQVAALVDSAPDTLNTLNELAAALGDDANFATTVATNLGKKADKTITITAGSGLTGGGSLASNFTIGHSNAVTAATAAGSSTKTLTFGGTFAIPTVTYDAQGHITNKGTTTMTMPSDRLFVTLVPTGTSIPANANLNTPTYMKVGRYFCSKTVDAATLQNCPTSVAFMMEVYSPLSTSIDNETTGTWVYRIRKITVYNTGMQFIQYASVGSTANTWSYGDWKVQPISNFTLNTSTKNGGSCAVGSSNTPVYIGSDGTISACTNVAKTNAANTFSAANTFNGSILLGTNNYGTGAPSSNNQLYFVEDNGITIPAPTSSTNGYVLTSNGSTPAWSANIASGIKASANSNTIFITGVASSTNTSLYYNTNVKIQDNVLMGAAWNDYAEYRICKDNFKPGQVICENGDDTLSISSTRLQPGAEIISDTFGFAIGETLDATCPVAVSGRVLAYTYEPRDEFKAGDCVCAGPNGTISKMTREEIREYPDRIIGTVSAIPSYETWNETVKVNNRIWIKVK